MKTAKQFQQVLIDHIAAHFNAAHVAYSEPGSDVIALRKEHGAVLLEAPTGVGKTFMATRAISKFSRHKKMLWFWFSPWAHLADQTEAALKEDAAGLTVTTLADERHADALTGSKVYALVWASLAAKDETRRKTREADDGKQDLATFVAEARAQGYRIGVVIDEAHHGVKSDTEASRLLRDVLQPEYHLFVTATPDDKELADFQAYMGLRRIKREVATRADGVAAGLIKPDVKVFYFEEGDESAGYLSAGVSLTSAAISKAVAKHNQLKADLDACVPGRLTPLLLVQVSSSSAEAELEAKKALVDAGVSESAIRIHTAAKPDRNLQQIANDHSVEALIFKMAVGTGFDAPRAFTLVSLRSSRSEQFGLQVLGRILRVHPALRALPAIPAALQNGYVFLVDATVQEGLSSAADRIKSIKQGVAEYVTSASFESGTSGAELSGKHQYNLKPDVASIALQTQVNARDTEDLDDLEATVAASVAVDASLLKAALLDEVTFDTRSRSAFEHNNESSDLGAATRVVNKDEIARRALAVLSSLPETDMRGLLTALAARMEAEYGKQGDIPEQDRIRHAVYLLSQVDPRNPLKETLHSLRTWTPVLRTAEPLPTTLESLVELPSSANNAYGVIPEGQWDSPDESRFALNKLDDNAQVIWWHRNPAKKSFSVGLAKADGTHFYPDFLARIEGAPTSNGLVLIEVKGEGWLTDAKVKEDFNTEHPAYGRPVFVVEVAGTWHFVQGSVGQNLGLGPRFTWAGLISMLSARAVS